MKVSDRLERLLDNAAQLRPSHTAIEDPERSSIISYDAFRRLTNDLQQLLVQCGVRPGDRVGIYAPKSIGTVASIFAILRAGGAYVPVDPTAPPRRNAFIFKDCSVRAIVAERRLVEGLQAELPASEPFAVAELRSFEPSTDLVLVRMLGEPHSLSSVEPGTLAYILYTSGSTGRPKGVMHSHASALAFVDWCSEALLPSERDRFSAHAPFHFDLSIFDIFVAMKHAATLLLIGEELGKQPKKLGPLIAERNISVWYSTPSILRLLVEYGNIQQYDYSKLRLVIFAGEVFSPKQFRALQSFWPHPRYFNLYGPTETNVCTYYEVPSELEGDLPEAFPIGKACSGDRAKAMDEHDTEVPPGQEGELYVSGWSVMLGYWNLKEQDRRAFFTDESGTRWYRTGDMVRETNDGSYFFIGRRDRMVKRRGYRVELGEIEAALYRHPSIAEAAVIAYPDEDSGVQIKAFLGWSDAGRPSLIALKQFCAENLPSYMIPDRFSFLSSLPKTSTDKVDYQKLKELD